MLNRSLEYFLIDGLARGARVDIQCRPDLQRSGQPCRPGLNVAGIKFMPAARAFAECRLKCLRQVAVSRLTLIFVICLLQAACHQLTRAQTQDQAAESNAKSLASSAYKDLFGQKVAKFDCHLVEETSSEWEFLCEDLDEAPPPDYDKLILVNKTTKIAKIANP